MTIPRFNAYKYVKTLQGGTTRPWQVLVDTGDEIPKPYVLKLFPRKDLEQSNYIAYEFLGSALASNFLLQSPKTILIQTTERFEQTIPKEKQLDYRACDSSIFFGSEYKEAIEFTPALNLRSLSKDDISLIFCLDALMANTDRRIEKPNMLVSDGSIFLIDHERCFGFKELNINLHAYLIKQHILYKPCKQHFKKVGQSFFDPFSFACQEMRFGELERLIADLKKLGFADEHEERWLDFLKQNITEPQKLIHLLSSLLA